MTAKMKRREFITLLGGAAAAWPLAARAQQDQRVRHLGMLINLAEDDPEAQRRIAEFRKGLQSFGWARVRTCGSTCVGASTPSAFAKTRRSLSRSDRT